MQFSVLCSTWNIIRWNFLLICELCLIYLQIYEVFCWVLLMSYWLFVIVKFLKCRVASCRMGKQQWELVMGGLLSFWFFSRENSLWSLNLESSASRGSPLKPCKKGLVQRYFDDLSLNKVQKFHLLLLWAHQKF